MTTMPRDDDAPDMPGLDDDAVEPDDDEVGDDDPDARNGLNRCRRVHHSPAVPRTIRL